TCTSRRSPRPLHPPPTLSSSSTRPAGTCRHASSYRPTSPSSRCHPNVPSPTRLRTCGSSCATTGSRTGSSNHTTISSTIVARPGTSPSISLGASCPSDCANGRTSSDQWDSVLGRKTSYLFSSGEACGDARGSAMADILISYSKSDHALALKLSAFLESEGWTVWWDKSLAAADLYRDEIMKQLAAARAVITIWSPNSIKSDWVPAEAGRAIDVVI